MNFRIYVIPHYSALFHIIPHYSVEHSEQWVKISETMHHSAFIPNYSELFRTIPNYSNYKNPSSPRPVLVCAKR